jgi:hypothetical protein
MSLDTFYHVTCFILKVFGDTTCPLVPLVSLLSIGLQFFVPIAFIWGESPHLPLMVRSLDIMEAFPLTYEVDFEFSSHFTCYLMPTDFTSGTSRLTEIFMAWDVRHGCKKLFSRRAQCKKPHSIWLRLQKVTSS